MKKYIFAVVILALAFLGFKFLNKEAAIAPVIDTATTTLTAGTSATSTGVTTVSATLGTDKDKAWAVLQNYLSFAKNNDIQGVIATSYQLSDPCKNYSKTPENKSDCDAKMQNVYIIGKEFIKSEYSSVWSDAKQVILSTPPARADIDGQAGMFHGVIFFVKEGSSIKLLSFNPARGIFLPISATSTEAEIKAKLDASVLDTDMDGLEDQVENCIRVSPACIKTDPTKRDTDGDGFWDGVEALFYK